MLNTFQGSNAIGSVRGARIASKFAGCHVAAVQSALDTEGTE